MQSDDLACLSCGAVGVPIAPRAQICGQCWQSPDKRSAYRCRELPVAPDICPHPPGTAERIAWMATRAEEGYSIFNSLDRTFEGTTAAIPPQRRQEVFALPELRIRGVERDGIFFRSRPYWLHRKWCLGSFRTVEQAEAVVRRFWIDRLHLFWMLGGRMGLFFVNEEAPDPPVPKYQDPARKAIRSARRGGLKTSRAKPARNGGLFRQQRSAVGGT